MNLKPQDVLVLLKLAVSPERRYTFDELAASVGMSPSEVHAALKRAEQAGLLNRATRVPNRRALVEFLVHGLKYVYSAERGSITRGMPTAHAAPPLSERFAPTDGLPPVWPDPTGAVRGEEFRPLYKSATKAAKNDPKLYELLALVDAVRGGRAREREMAEAELRTRLLA